MTQPLPDNRPQLLALHAEARHRRERAALGGPEYRQACEEIAAIEVQIARIALAPNAAAPSPAAPEAGA